MSRFPFILPSVPSQQLVNRKPGLCLFYTDPKEVEDENLSSVLKNMGITHLGTQVFNSPVDTQLYKANECIDNWETNEYPRIRSIGLNGFRMIGYGDSFLRWEKYRDWADNHPDAKPIIQHIAHRIGKLDFCDGIDMVDETEQNLQQYKPFQFVEWWKAAKGPPLAWPGHYPQAFELPPLCDYQSRYWHWWNAGHIADQCERIKKSTLHLQKDKMWSGFMNCVHKEVMLPDGTFRVSTTPVHPDELMAQLWVLLGYNASRVRIWARQSSLWDTERAMAVPGKTIMVGAARGTLMWEGLVKATKSLKQWKGHLWGQPFEPTESGPWFFGRRGGTIWAVNRSQVALPDPRPRSNKVYEPYEVAFWSL